MCKRWRGHLHTGCIESISGELSFRVSKGLLHCLLTLVPLSGSKPFWSWSFVCDMIFFSLLPKAFSLPHCSELTQFYFGEQSSIQLHVHYLSHVLHFWESFHDFLSMSSPTPHCFFPKICLCWSSSLVFHFFFNLLYFPFLSLPHLQCLLPSLNWSYPQIEKQCAMWSTSLSLPCVNTALVIFASSNALLDLKA